MHDIAQSIGGAIVLILALTASLPCLYLLLLTVLSARLPHSRASSRTLCFDVIVPAHDEAAGIARTIDNLLALDWPRHLFRVLAIADNCTDNTADVARAAGAEVLVRTEPERRGKGYALAFAFAASRADGRAAAVVVVDADSKTSPNLLEAFAARLEGGAVAVQAHYGVLNAFASWRTRLMAIALGSFHKLRSRGRERLGVSCGIRGNGWCVTHALLARVPYRAFSLTEDIEFGIELGLHGCRVAYTEDAWVDGEMVTSAAAAKSQRQRWEGGRLKLIATQMPLLARAFLARGDAVCLDLALDLLVMPLSYLVLNVLALAIAALLVGHLAGHGPAWTAAAAAGALEAAAVDAAILVLYVLRGWRLSHVGARGLLDLARAPGFVLWKVLLMVSGRKVQQWVRTHREAP
jgi:cellulose synthase/poly-beta-1,6-N-acetylglucosamine synthase-like glycosyltransferase